MQEINSYFYTRMRITKETRRMQRKGLIGWMCALSCAGALLPGQAQEKKDNHFEVSKNLEIFNSLVKETEMFYVDTVDVEKAVRRGIDAMLDGLDPYTEYIPEQEMDDFKQLVTGEYGGIGAYIRQRNEKGNVMIAEPFEGMPAAEAGLKAGDVIVAIDTVNVSSFTNDKVTGLLQGVPNSKVTLTIRRPGEKKTRKFDVIRRQIQIDQVTWYGVRGDSVGYIYLKGFTDKCAQEVKNAFLDLRNNRHVKSLILDLRDNGGGVLESAVQIVGMFVPKGNVVLSTKSKHAEMDRTYRTAGDPIDTVMPLAVLINENSASAAEIVSGALQDMDRAVLVGQRSYGKGLVQSMRDLPYDGSLKVTISKYYIPSGRCIQQLDYTHRRADGSVEAIPDSLTKVFHTAKGRPVRDGGGVRPEFEVKADKLPSMMYYLAVDTVFFDFVTDWVRQHPSIPPVEEFSAGDADFEALKAYTKEKGFTYDRQSEKALKNLEEVAEFEGYLEGDSAWLKTLEAKLTPNLEQDFDHFKEEVKHMLETEIIKRYYYQKGELLAGLKNDDVLKKALEVLADRALYRKALAPPEGK